ncbi:MAG: L-ribulose-5-phosphate 4-epimerase AraD, partial [Verrucomicrobia bacterium]|nr:L-ribulose-5-phosphate 4-epimerase AraD [Verrucomicrobiota bacterium]
MLEQLKEEVCAANLRLKTENLVILTWGNVSAIDRHSGMVAIKPSGVSYDRLRPEDIVIVSLESGATVEGTLKPSSDTPTHLELYRSFPDIGAIVHTHSIHATAWAQACAEIPAFGTTHADYFNGPIPCTRIMWAEEVQSDYELNTGKVIVERFKDLDPQHCPAVLVAHHGPFVWGDTADKAVENALVLEQLALMATQTRL